MALTIQNGWSANRRGALSSALFRRVEVPLALRGGAPYPRSGVHSLAGRRKAEGMETSKRARRRKPDTAKADLKPPLAVSGGQGVHREMESEGHEEKFRAVIKGSPSDEPVGQRWVRSSPHHEGEGVLIHPPYQGDCGRHGTEEQRV